jgi:hypothetical protein
MQLWSFGRREASRLALVLAVTLLAGLPSTRLGFGADDQYILARASSPALLDRLAVYTVEVPGPLTQRIGAWWMGLEYRRHFVRIPPSIAVSAERSMFGMEPRGYHLVALLLYAINALLLYGLLRRLAPRGALIATILFAAHPAIHEMVGWLAVAATLFGTAFSLVALLAATASDRVSETARWSGVVCVTATGLAMLSYEAMVGLPLLLLILSRTELAGSALRRRGVQVALLSLVPAYFALRHALGTTDLSFRGGCISCRGSRLRSTAARADASAARALGRTEPEPVPDAPARSGPRALASRRGAHASRVRVRRAGAHARVPGSDVGADRSSPRGAAVRREMRSRPD